MSNFVVVFLGLKTEFKTTVWINASTLEAIQYTPIPMGNWKVKYNENSGIPKVMHPIAGFLLISGFVSFCLSIEKMLVPKEVTPERMGTSQSRLGSLIDGV